MRTTIRKVGNSRGIIIPAAFIATCGFGDEVELSVDGAKLVIEAAQAHRRGWLHGYNHNNDVEVLAALPLDDLGEDWSW